MGTLDLTWQDIKKQNQTASEWLLYYHQKRQSYFLMLNNFSELAATQYTGMPHGSGISNPTAQKAVDLSRLKEYELWIMTIEDVERILSPKKKVFLEVRRQAEMIKHDGDNGRPNWAGYVQVNYAEKISRIYGYDHVPSERTMRSWWNEMADLVVRIAIKRGCL
jgi:hypothetical protein